MIGWMRRRFVRQEQVAPQPAGPAPGRDAEILEAIQKSARVQAKLSTRLEALESKIEGGFTELRAATGAGASMASARASIRWDDLLDAMDLLEAAVRSIRASEAREAAEGLQGILSRLGRFLGQAGLVRVGAPERLGDGKLFRVVGTERVPDLADGAIARLVRSAVLEGDRVVREGEVIVNRRDS
jgi:molecular chaperone GrpE (heat shock protein)